MNKCNPKGLKISLFVSSILLLPCVGIAIWLGYIVYDNPVVAIISEGLEFDFKNFGFWFGVSISILLSIVSIGGIIITFKSHGVLNTFFTSIVTIAIIFFIALGIGTIIGGFQYADEVRELCDEDVANSDFQKTLKQGYLLADTIFCKAPPSGGPCYYTHSMTPAETLFYTKSTSESDPGTVFNVQECETSIVGAYATFTMSSDEVRDIIRILNYFGEVERDYDCSGICDYKPIYYFSDSRNGSPPQKCEDPIVEEVLMKELLAVGIGFVILGIFMAVVTVVHWGFFCKKPENYKSAQSVSAVGSYVA